MRTIQYLAATLVITLLVVFSTGPSKVHALEVISSSVDHLESPDFAVRLSSSDPTGTVVLAIGDRTVATALARPGQRVDFGRNNLRPGRHTAVALLRTADGVERSKPFTVRVWGKPMPATLVSPTPGSYASRYVAGLISTGSATTRVEVYLNGRRIRDEAVIEKSTQRLGTLELGPGVNTFRLVAHNPVARTESSFTVTRLDFPWPTCIVIDKSEFRLYWVKDGQLIKVYPVAHGRVNARTPSAIWRIDAKYYSDPRGVYGPRKMRLFRQNSSGYVYTRYLIHGTNQPWVIGTQASAGCIRMYNADVLELWPQVPLGTMVQTRD